jgi:hypothetical protein
VPLVVGLWARITLHRVAPSPPRWTTVGVAPSSYSGPDGQHGNRRGLWPLTRLAPQVRTIQTALIGAAGRDEFGPNVRNLDGFSLTRRGGHVG